MTEPLRTTERAYPRPESLTDWVYRAIRDAIVSRELAPGARVTESTLAKWLKVSKTPVRETLLRLQLMGLIESDGSRAAGRVVRPSRESIRNAFEIRQGLEAQAAWLVASRGSRSAIDTIIAAAERSLSEARAGRVDGFREWDERLHHAIAEATDNSALFQRITDVFALVWTLRRRDAPSLDHSVQCGMQHTELAEAIMEHDPERASQVMREHIQTVMDAVLSLPMDDDAVD